MPKTARYADAVCSLKTQMQALVRQAATDLGSVKMRLQHADNYWTITVLPDGTVLNEDYAEDARGSRSRLEDLAFWELAHLVDTL